MLYAIYDTEIDEVKENIAELFYSVWPYRVFNKELPDWEIRYLLKEGRKTGQSTVVSKNVAV